MINKIWKMFKTIGTCVVAISSLGATAALIVELFEKKNSRHISYGVYEKYVKRPLDVFLSTGALFVLSPVLITVAALVRFKLGSPVIFRQERPGKDGKIFTLYKFRTMLQPKDGIIDVAKDSERMTEFGRKLRASSLDELPELINIIKGDMSVIGPRPLLPQYLERYNERQARRHEVRPGLTGMAQIHGRNSIDWNEKFEWDVNYLDHITFLGDCRVIADTIKVMLSRKGISGHNVSTMTEFMGNTE